MKLRLTVLAIAFVCLSSVAQAPTQGRAGTPLHWLLLTKAYSALKSDSVANRFFSGPETYLIGPAKADGAASGPTPTRAYSSYAQIEKAFADGTAPKKGAILYDNEKWSFTPDNEKSEPAKYEQMAAGLAHAHGLTFIATPAMNLSTYLQPGAGKAGPSGMSQQYLQLGLARDAAHAADVIDIQAQSLQYDSAEYARVVSEAAQQARSANPHVIVLAGLTTRTRRDGTPATAANLLAAVKATRGVVDGYWLNIPMKSEYCPNCGEFRPEIAIDFLHQLASNGGN